MFKFIARRWTLLRWFLGDCLIDFGCWLSGDNYKDEYVCHPPEDMWAVDEEDTF